MAAAAGVLVSSFTSGRRDLKKAAALFHGYLPACSRSKLAVSPFFVRQIVYRILVNGGFTTAKNALFCSFSASLYINGVLVVVTRKFCSLGRPFPVVVVVVRSFSFHGFTDG